MIVAIICAVVGLLIGAGIYYLISRITAANLIKKAEEEAEMIKKNKIVEAKEKFIALKLEHDNSVREQDKRLQQQRLQGANTDWTSIQTQAKGRTSCKSKHRKATRCF